jgi:voltage-gated potassium channel
MPTSSDTDPQRSRRLARLMRWRLRRSRHRARVRLLVARPHVSAARTIALRAGLVLALFALAMLVFWIDRDGLRDTVDGAVSFLDVVYFTMVTVTTVGYGDIVPISDRARIVDGLFVTPIRIFIWFIFLGTAYQMVVQRWFEERQLRKFEQSLKDHIVLFGFGHSGRIAALELVEKGNAPHKIVVIDTSEAAAQAAAEAGFLAMVGDAASEGVQRQAAVPEARAIIVCLRRDDTGVLAVLTARDLAPKARIIASCREAENAKLLRRSGADVIVSSARVGGYLMADAVDSAYTVALINDILTERGRVRLSERNPLPGEIGRGPRELDCLVIGLEREGKRIGFWDAEGITLEPDDLLLVIEANAPAARG